MNKTVHRIWLNRVPPPPSLQRFTDSWGDHVRVWSRDEILEIESIKPLLKLAKEVWGGEKFLPMSDIARCAILANHGGLYVDMDCERVGDVWPIIDSKCVGHQELVLVRPARPSALDHPRCCNGVMYQDEESTMPLGSISLTLVLESMHSRLDMAASQKRETGKAPRPVDATGPMTLWFHKRLWNVPMIDGPFAAFKGCETPDTRIVIHQGWRKYDA